MTEFDAVAEVDPEFIKKVEKYQGKRFLRIGAFDVSLLREFVEMIDEVDLEGEVEILVTSGNRMHDDTTAGMIVARFNETGYVALAGLSDP